MTRVLVVDDEAAVRLLLRRWLEASGHQVHEAADAESALRIAKATEAAVVVVDLQMPGHDGLWLADRLRTECPEAGVVLATADATVPPMVSLRPGICGYVVKPFDPPRLMAAVAGAAAWHQQQVRRTGSLASDPFADLFAEGGETSGPKRAQ